MTDTAILDIDEDFVGARCGDGDFHVPDLYRNVSVCRETTTELLEEEALELLGSGSRRDRNLRPPSFSMTCAHCSVGILGAAAV